MSEPKLQGKSYDIPKQLVWDAWLKVKRNGGAAGADGVTIEVGPLGRAVQFGVGVGPGRGTGISPGPFPRPALRTRRARLRATGSPRVSDGYAVLAADSLVHGVEMLWPRQR